MTTENEGSEVLVFTNQSKDIANKLRAEIINNFPKVWVYVYNLDKKTEVKVASNWAGRLDKKTLNEIEEFVKVFEGKEVVSEKVEVLDKPKKPPTSGILMV
jgi:hypothetical protein